MTICNFYWGSHGCDLERGNHAVHVCGTPEGPCCEYDESRPARVRYMEFDEDLTPVGWGDWMPAPHGWRQ